MKRSSSAGCGEDKCRSSPGRAESELNVECELVVVGEERVVELESELQGEAVVGDVEVAGLVMVWVRD